MNSATKPSGSPASDSARNGGAPPHRTDAPRIAYVMSRFPKITETFVLYEMKAMEDRGVSVEVFPLRRQPPGPRHPAAEGYERRAQFLPFLSAEVVRSNVKRFLADPLTYVGAWWEAVSGTWGNLRFLLGAVAFFPKCVAMAARMERLEVDHVHAHFATHPALAALIVHRLTGISYSFTAHGSDLHVDRRMLAEKVGSAAFVVTVSRYNRRLIAEECGEGALRKTMVIHCGVDPTRFGTRENGSDPAYARGDVPESAPLLRIACVASLEDVKGHRFLLRACRLLADAGVRVRCDFAGAGPRRAALERLVVELGLERWVRMHGAVPRPEVERILAGADVAVLASCPTVDGRREGIPVALMEAMMSGLPVVASAISGIPELVSDGQDGFLVVPGDPWHLADRLFLLAHTPALRHRLGTAARAKVSSEFDLGTGALLLSRAIERSLARRGAATLDAFPRPS